MQSLNRHPERGLTDRAGLDAILDSGLVAHLATVVDGEPWVIPILYARDGDRILLHGSTGAGLLRHLAAGAPVVASVAHLDGLVIAESTFEHSANYRSAVVRGVVTKLDGDEAWAALDLLSNVLVPGRTEEVRPMRRKEVAATQVLALPIIEGQWLVKTRVGTAAEPDEATDAWMGVVPLHTVAGEPEPAPWSVERELPASVGRLLDRWPHP